MRSERRGRHARRRLVLALTSIAATALLAAVASADGPAATAPADAAASAASATVDPVLRAQLRRAKTAPATVTTWASADLARVKRLGVRGTALRSLPMLLAPALTRAQLRALEQSPAVRSVYANRQNRVLMEETTWITKAREVWAATSAGGLGVTGKGVHLAVIDTGADGQHEDMDNLVEFCETTQAVSGDRTTVVCSPHKAGSGNVPAPANDPRIFGHDDEGHGSHVSGTVAGSGQASGGRAATHSTIGIAPDAKLHVYSANVGPALLDHEILASYDDMINKKLVGLSEVVAVNNSWGGGGGTNYNPDDPQHVAFKRAYDANILSVFAAGNSGPEHNTLGRQCVSPWVVCVAASTKPDAVVMFSSRGRPSEPADTNRDGVVGGPGDVAPDNHDRALGQALGLGLYRPTLTAPGANINSIAANSAQCREGGVTADSGCYELLSGTSMAAPHVTGAVGLIVDAYRQGHGGGTPSPAMVTDILERSAAFSKLPGYEAEEQGAGRLNLLKAVQFAKTYPDGLPRPVLGTPTPAYAAGGHPGAGGTRYTEKGCTGTLSWTIPGAENPLDVEGPPLATSRFAEHVIQVGENVERLRVTVDWSRHAATNLYVRLWRPGVDPDQETASAGQARVFPDQESTGLLAGNLPFFGPIRWLDIRATESSTLEEGPWVLRVYHRVGGTPAPCDADSAERPKQTEGYNYTVRVERTLVADTPTVTVTSPADGATVSGRFVPIQGTASYPERGPGVTNWEVPGSGRTTPVHADPNPGNPRTVLHFHGNPGNPAVPGEALCTGDGRADLVACSGPMLLKSGSLSTGTAGSWKGSALEWNRKGANDRTVFDPSWVWCLAPGPMCPVGTTEAPAQGPVTVEGAMTVDWWATCGPLCVFGIGNWIVRVWADGVERFETQVAAGPLLPTVPARLRATVVLPRITASQRLTLQLEPVFLVNEYLPFSIWYDSQSPCPAAAAGTSCDSLVRMPVGTSGLGGSGGNGPGPSGVRVTDHHDSLVVAWNELAGATGYEVHRSTQPGFAPTAETLLATTAGTPCSSPDVPTWPSASRSGLCYTDAAVSVGTTYYYRLIGLNDAGKTNYSLLAYGTPSAYDRQVKLKVDRLYGPQYWEYATLLDETGTTWSYTWDTLELFFGTHAIGARSFTQGVGSAKRRLAVNLVEGGGAGGKVRICHATGADPPYMAVTTSKAGVANGHFGAKHAGGQDIIPPFEWKGQTYSQNWPAGQVVWENDCRPSG